MTFLKLQMIRLAVTQNVDILVSGLDNIDVSFIFSNRLWKIKRIKPWSINLCELYVYHDIHGDWYFLDIMITARFAADKNQPRTVIISFICVNITLIPPLPKDQKNFFFIIQKVIAMAKKDIH